MQILSYNFILTFYQFMTYQLFRLTFTRLKVRLEKLKIQTA